MTAQPVYSSDVSLEPYWWDSAPLRATEPVHIGREVDVAVIGSGYTGLAAALTLARAGRSVTVFEAGRIGHGASTRNGGAVGGTLRISFAAMLRRFGQQRAVALYTGVTEARSFIEHLIEREGIKCHYARVGRFVGAHRPVDYEAMAHDLTLRKRLVGFEADMVPGAEMQQVIGTDAYHGGRLMHGDGNLHPALFHQGILDRALSAGAVVAAETPVRSVRRERERFELALDGRRLVAREVIVATNGYTGKLSPWLARRLIPIQSQIIATAPLPANTIERLIPQRRQIGDTRRLHNYYRTSPDGTRILFGGRAGAGELDDRRRSGLHLRAQMLDIFPELAGVEITHAWAGFIAYTFDALPHLTVDDGIHYAAGYCGSGVAMAPYLGHKIALRVLGSPEATTPFCSPYSTFPGYGGKAWFMPAVTWYYGMRDRMRI